MIRLTWRQFRFPAAVALGALLLVAVFAALTGPELARLHAATMADCGPDCSSVLAAFVRTHQGLRTTLGTLVAVVPGLLGVFWGAPLVAREVEAGTFPLVWTQSVSRTRWLAVKLAVVGAAAALAAGLLSLAVTWWARPLDVAAAARYDTFGDRDVVPVGYALLAFGIGVAAGLLIRRTVPAMAVTLFTFVLVRICVTYGVRPRLFGPVHRVLALDPASTGVGTETSPSLLLKALFSGGPSSSLEPATPYLPDAWLYSTRVVDGSGHDLTDRVLDATCPHLVDGGGGGPTVNGHTGVPDAVQQSMQTCITKIGATYHELLTYQPAARYWAFQWAELAIFGGAALVLGGFCLWWVRRGRIA